MCPNLKFCRHIQQTQVPLFVLMKSRLYIFVLRNVQINHNFPKIAMIFYFSDDINYKTKSVLRKISYHFTVLGFTVVYFWGLQGPLPVVLVCQMCW